MKIKSKPLHVSWLGYIAIYSALLSFRCTVILLIWHIKQPRLNANCSKMVRVANPCHLVRGLHLEEASQSQSFLLHRQLQKVHLEANIPMFKVFLVGTTLLPQA
jgi:hypothetical protein